MNSVYMAAILKNKMATISIFRKKWKHRFSDSEHSKVSKNVERSKLTDTSKETLF